MAETSRTGQTRRRVLLAAFMGAAVLAGFFAVRFTVHAIYWSQHRDDPIEEWMTVGYVAHAYDVSQQDLYAALGLAQGQPDRRSLGEIATSSGLTFEEVRTRLVSAIETARDTGQPPAATAEP